ncbi:MAG: B12-binding domain-containing radical SAM protein, partial [Promethearchaeota archaeon]
MRKKILFIQPFQFVRKKMFNDIPIWPVYLENYLKSKIDDLKVEIIHLLVESGGIIEYENFTYDDLINKCFLIMDNAISKLNFEIDKNTCVCISGTTSFHYLPVKLIAEYFQKYYPEAIIVFGGGHASSVPRDFSYPNSPIDYVAIGEGEIPLYNLIKNGIKKQEFPKILEKNPIPVLDDLPSLNLSILDKYIRNFDHLSISLSRGCPYNCYYCMERALRKEGVEGWRVFSPKKAVQETDIMINYGLDNNINVFGFQDPMFGLDKKWINDYLDLVNIDEKVSVLWIENRVDLLDENLLKKFISKKMAQMHGLESCSKKMLKIMNKTSNPTEYLKKFDKLIGLYRKLECRYSLNLVFNHPGETQQSYQETFNYVRNIAEKDINNSVNFEIILYHQFPGNRIYNGINYFNR